MPVVQKVINVKYVNPATPFSGRDFEQDLRLAVTVIEPTSAPLP